MWKWYISRKMIDKGAFVYAFDYAESAINLTKKNNNFPSSELASVEILDISTTKIPDIDLAISIGVFHI